LKWQLEKIQREYTRALNLPEGAKLQYSLCDKLLQKRCTDSLAFRAFIELYAHRGRLTVLIYYDEVVPGNVIAPDNLRRSTLLYFTFGELLDLVGNCEAAWITIGLIRTTHLEFVDGGMSTVMNLFLPHFIGMWPEEGIVITFNDKTWLVRTKPEILFNGDIAGHKGVFGYKGSSGLKACRICSNVCSKAVGRTLQLRGLNMPELCDISESDVSKFVPITNEETWEAVEHLQEFATRSSKTRLEKEETLLGWNFIPNGVMLNVALRPFVKSGNAHVDHMHTNYSNGIANKEISLFLQACSKKLDAWSLKDFQQYASQWKPNYVKPENAPTALRSKLLNRAGPYAGSASQCKVMMELLATYAQTVLCDCEPIAAELASLASLAEVLREINAIKNRCKLRESSNLKELQAAHLEAFVHAYGRHEVIPKHHEGFHLIDQWTERVVDCWTTERKNKIFKEEAALHTRLENFERNVLASLLAKEAAIAKKLIMHVELVGPSVLLDIASAVSLGLAGQVRIGHIAHLPRTRHLRTGMMFLLQMKADWYLLSASAMLQDIRSMFCLCEVHSKVAYLICFTGLFC
jgi:hypothetical protein